MANNIAVSFDDMIQADRKKRVAQNLAQDILGSRKSTASPVNSFGTRKPPTAPSLASRMGITKRSSSVQPKSNIDGKWGHDLHHVNNPQTHRNAHLSRTSSASNIDRGNRILGSLQRDVAQGAKSQATVKQGSQMSIRGIAKTGPYVVVASNFAPGTTAEDIEAAMAPVGGGVQSCQLISSSPTVMCELVFAEKDGADNVVATFNSQKADGRLLYVYHKQGGPTPHLHPLQTAANAVTSSAAPVDEVVSAPAQNKIAPAKKEVSVAVQGEERDLMDVDDERPANSNGRFGRDQRYGDRERYRDLERARDRDNNGYSDGRQSFRESYDRHDTRRDYGRSRGSRGLYSDNMYGDGRRYR